MTRLNYKTKQVKAPFDRVLEKLQQENYEIAPLWLNAQLREQEGYSAEISRYGNYVREGVLYQRKENTRLLPRSLCLDHPKEATQAHRNGKEFSLKQHKDEVEQARELGLEIDEKDLNGNGYLVIPTKSFGSDKYALHLFGGKGSDKVKSKRAKTHGEWLLNSPQNIEQITLYLNNRSYIDDQSYPYANQFWFAGLDDWSGLLGYGYLYYYYWGCGVQKSGEATQKISGVKRPYTAGQVNRNLRILDRIREGKVKISDLEKEVEKVAKFLESLKQ